MSPYSWDMCQSSHLGMCSGKMCRMETVCLSTECSSSQQLNETIKVIERENTNDYENKIIWSWKSENWKRLLEKLRKENHNPKICSLKIREGKIETSGKNKTRKVYKLRAWESQGHKKSIMWKQSVSNKFSEILPFFSWGSSEK